MDPMPGATAAIELASGIVTLGDLAVESSKTLNSLRIRLMDMTAGLDKLMNTVESLSALIIELQKTMQSHSDLPQNLVSQWGVRLVEVRNDFQLFRALVANMVERLGRRSALGLHIRVRAKWVFSEETITKYNERFASHFQFLELIRNISIRFVRFDFV